MDIFNTFALDENKLTAGVWHVLTATGSEPVDEHEIGERTAICIASTDNPKYQQLMEQKLEPYRQKRKEITREVTDRVIAECIAELVVIDWRNWIVQGVALSHNKDLIIEIWTKPKWTLLKERILTIIGNRDLFKYQREESIIKN